MYSQKTLTCSSDKVMCSGILCNFLNAVCFLSIHTIYSQDFHSCPIAILCLLKYAIRYGFFSLPLLIINTLSILPSSLVYSFLTSFALIPIVLRLNASQSFIVGAFGLSEPIPHAHRTIVITKTISHYIVISPIFHYSVLVIDYNIIPL